MQRVIRKRTGRKTGIGQKTASVLLPEEKLQSALCLYPGKSRKEVKELLWQELGKKLLLALLVSVCCLFSALWVFMTKKEDDGTVVRPLPGEASVIQKLRLEREEKSLSLELEIGAREYTEEQIEKLQEEAEQYLMQVIWGNNECGDYIQENLYFPEKLPDTGSSIYWSTDKPWLIDSEGTVHNEELEEAVQVELRAEIVYGAESRYFHSIVTVYPKAYTAEETLVREAEAVLQSLEAESRSREEFELPENLFGFYLVREEEYSFRKEAFLVLLAVTVPLLMYSGYFSTLEKRQKERRAQAESGYMEFITKLSVLMAAGVSVRQAFYRLAAEYEKNYGEKYVLTMELKVTIQELENGYSESEVYEAFGRRMGILPYQRMASLLTQNVAKGVQGIRGLLLQEAKEALEQERAAIKLKGEQAGTKLLFPMMGLLFLVFAILLVPAFQSF